jgi:hypothetical protein
MGEAIAPLAPFPLATPLGWDDLVPVDVNQKWRAYRTNIAHLNNVTIPRFILGENKIMEIQIHDYWYFYAIRSS